MRRILVLFLICFAGTNIFACTTFCINKNGQIVFGRNYDWITGAGMVCSNQRGLFKTSLRLGNAATISWISKYGSISFNQYGKEFPTGGMNEKGLVVELMWLDETRYPDLDTRPVLGVLQWIQYQLDHAASVAEVIASDSVIRINDPATPQHYLVADASGEVVSIEFLHGKMVVHTGKELPYPVLANDSYAYALQTTKSSLSKKDPHYPGNNSLDRFVKACSMVKQFTETDINMPATNFAFSILEKVAQPGYTKWSIVYDISNKKIYFKTAAYTSIKNFTFGAFDFTCSKTPKIFNMNQDGAGNINSRFVWADKKIQQQILRQAIAEGINQVAISKKEEEALLGYEDGVSCKH